MATQLQKSNSGLIVMTGSIKFNELSEFKELGKGGCGIVYTAKYKKRKVVVKTIVNGNQFDTSNEILMLKNCRGNNIVEYIGTCVYSNNLLIVMEFYNHGDLASYIIKKKKPLTNKSKKRIMNGLLNGLRELHQKNIIHGDIKPHNILMDNDLNPHISDFGLSHIKTKLTNSFTPEYASPELKEKGLSTKGADIWAMGHVLLSVWNWEVVANNYIINGGRSVNVAADDINQYIVDNCLHPNLTSRNINFNIK